MASRLLSTKPLDVILRETEETSHGLKRSLGPINLTTLGVGAVIGAGIFVLTGQAAAQYAGPAVVLSFTLAFFACLFAGLCYAEFASLIPIAGSAYTYGYATLGEIFAWIGFDAVSTTAQEAKNPQRDMPIGIMGSLLICTVLYILVSGILTAVVPYTSLNVADPVAVGIDATGVVWGSILVKIGAILGLATVMLVMLLGQSRVFYTMSNDGLLPPWASRIHPKFRTPWISTIAVGIFVAIFAAILPIDVLGELVSIGTLLAFVIVSAGVWILRRRRPDLPRPFKTPWVPFVPIMGIVVSTFLMLSLPLATWLRLIIWLIVGLLVYYFYGRKHSKVRLMNANADRAT